MIASNKNLEDVILRTIDIIASQKIAKAGYDKTIQATVISCIDETTGKYKVKYQDSYWVVYSSNPDVYYTPNTNVYVLIPGGDLSKDKTILGTTKRLGASYVPTSDIEKRLCPVGTNVANSDMIWSLCSYKTETKILYSSSFSDQQNLLNIDKEAAIEYIRNATSIIAGAYIKNNLDTEQRYRGNYGILFGLDFMDTATNQIVTRYYSIDVDNMSGNPYYYPNEVQQYENFDIDESNFVEVNTIAIFTKDFPNQSDDKPDDIFISKIELSGAISLQDADLEASTLVLLSPKGYIFTEDSLDTDERILKAQVRNQGKVIDAKSQKIEFYWFIENLSITTGSSKYNRYGGQGWECLNHYEIVQPETINNGVTVPAVLSFSPGDDNFSIKKSQVFAKTTRYKCVAIYNNTVLSKEAKIVRNDSQYDIQVSSTKGTQFYNNAGITDLICDCKQRDGNIVDPDTLKFVWAVINNVGNFNSLPTTVEYNDELQKLTAVKNAINKYLEADWILYQTVYDVNRLLPNNTTINSISDTNQKTQVTNARLILINAGLITTNDINTLLNKNNVLTTNLTYSTILNNGNNSLTKAINNYDKIQRVINNKVTGIPINSITNFSTFKCSVFTKTGNIFLGSGSITLLNFPEGGGYNLVIENGTQVFKYNTHGVSPASQQKENPLTIPALTFTIYDNMGNKLEDNVVKNVKTTWTVPSNNTLLKTNYNNGIPDSALQTVSYKNLSTFVYTIAENYNVNYTRNDIELKVQYNGLTLYAKTNLSFLKQGDSSTNGTDFVCKIIPNVTSGNIPVNPIIYYNSNKTVSFNWNVVSNNQWFKAQLWHNGNEPIFEGINSGDSLEGKPVTIVKWEVLKNVYTSNEMDETNLEANISNNSWSFKFNAETYSRTGESSISNNYPNWRPANIIKVTLSYDGMTYYATLPVITCRFFVADYKVELKDHTGFRQVLYDASGQFPKYDSHAPFEILTFKKVNNNWEDISNKNSVDLKLKYDWYYLGSVFNRTNDGWWEEEVETTDLSTGESSKKWLLKDNLITQIEPNKKAVRPVDSYNGECVNIALACRIYLQSNSTTIAWIHIPIHMLRNRFENSAINGWDGNSVNLGGSNGGMILAPQAGAGVKDSNNRFTGVFIGTSKDPNADSSSAVGNIKANEDVGLFGYNKGSRSIFLDAKTGKAVFGEKQKSQIILDPANNRAEIKSGNYSTISKTGMMIDFTTPEIKFGSGNFSVNKYGQIIAKGSGEIAGWKINNTAIFNKAIQYNNNDDDDDYDDDQLVLKDDEEEDRSIAEGITGMNSMPDILNSGSKRINVPIANIIQNGQEDQWQWQAQQLYEDDTLDDDEPQQVSNIKVDKTARKTEQKTIAFWAGGENFYVTHDGYLRAKEACIGAGGPQNLIYIGKGATASSHSAIFSGNKNQIEASAYGFYLGTDGIGIGPSFNIPQMGKNVSNFQVQNDGTLYARKGYIGNGNQGWEFGSHYLRNGKSSFTNYVNNGIYIGTNGISIGSFDETHNAFSVTAKGVFAARKGTIFEGVKILGTLTAKQIIAGKINKHTIKWRKMKVVQDMAVHTKTKIVGSLPDGLTGEVEYVDLRYVSGISWSYAMVYLLTDSQNITTKTQMSGDREKTDVIVVDDEHPSPYVIEVPVD